jgi:large subunit ribosomal protein L38e
MEVTSLEKFVEITSRAVECRVKRYKKTKLVKVKARTKRYLYTFKTTEDKLDEVLSKVKCPKIIDVDEGREIERK